MARKVAISRGGYCPSSPNEAKKLVAEFVLATIGVELTQISQTLLLNITNYNYLTSVPDTGKDTAAVNAMLRKTVKELNEFCRSNKIPLGLLIMPHTSSSEYAGDNVTAIPWEHVAKNPQAKSAINSLFELVARDGYHQFVADAKTFNIEGTNVLR